MLTEGFTEVLITAAGVAGGIAAAGAMLLARRPVAVRPEPARPSSPPADVEPAAAAGRPHRSTGGGA